MPLLNDPVLTRLKEIRHADILVGIPSYNNARTIEHVVKAVLAGFARYFPGLRCVLVNSDGGSTDGTPDVVMNTVADDRAAIFVRHAGEGGFRIATPYHGVPGKGSAFRTIFEIARRLDAKACAVVDSDLRSITPEWIELLVKPVIDHGFDYVAPLYLRHKYDGTITNSIIYPLTRALYGKRIRQPIGGDFGFSGALASFYLTKDVWDSDVARYGIDIWMTTTAVANDYRICQSYLGAKIHDPKDPGADLSAMLHQVVGAAFDLMNTYERVWMSHEESADTPVFGFRYAVGLEPVPVNLPRMIERFRLGAEELGDVWDKVLSRKIIKEIRRSAHMDPDIFHVSDDIWVDIIYAFAVAAKRKAVYREHLLKSLTPLYIGRTASFIREMWDADMNEVEKRIEELCLRFEQAKPMLKTLWSSKEAP
ncbi:MAG TPA: glycosyltransferase [Dissulfurispiraceae bacterium]|nr:glycosyltransferase [Dissulfurispiraceae bacterium]